MTDFYLDWEPALNDVYFSDSQNSDELILLFYN